MEGEKLIVVTGFGPFEGHELVNASWEAVRLLPNAIKYDGTTYKLQKKLVPVVYEKVDRIVDEIWKNNPDLVIHCGVHGSAKSIHLEKFAYNNEFCRPDYSGKNLECSKVCLANNGSECEKILTKIDVDIIAESINSLTTVENACTCSEDVGNYLCGYIYLRSLDMSCERCLFIHVPPIDEPFTSEQTSEIIHQVIQKCLAQVCVKSE